MLSGEAIKWASLIASDTKDMATNIKTLLSLLIGSGNTLSNNILFIDFTGSHEAAQLLSQLYYWSSRGSSPDGWFKKTYQELWDEVRIKERSCRRHLNQFKKDGYLDTKTKKWNGIPSLHIKLDDDLLISQLSDFASKNYTKSLPDRSGQIDRNQGTGQSDRIEPDTVTETKEPDTVTGSTNRDNKIINKEMGKWLTPFSTDEDSFKDFKNQVYLHLLGKLKAHSSIIGPRFWAIHETNKFFEHYQTVKWKVKSKKMSSWKTAASGWVNRGLERKTYFKGRSPEDPLFDQDPWGNKEKVLQEKPAGVYDVDLSKINKQ